MAFSTKQRARKKEREGRREGKRMGGKGEGDRQIYIYIERER